MKNHKRNASIPSMLLLLALLSTACVANFKSPLAGLTPGETRTVAIEVPYTGGAEPVVLNLEFIAGNLKLAPGNADRIVSGKATFNVPELEPVIQSNGSMVTLKAGDLKIEGMPTCPDDVVNSWDLQLGNIPMELNLTAGAYDALLEFGGIPFEKMTISEMGSTETITFSQPNPVEMSLLSFSTGGSTLVMKGLANANFAQMDFNSGAGDYTLSFDGKLQRNGNVSIKSGAATITIIVPVGVNALVTYIGGLSDVNIEGGWEQSDNIYTQSGNGPTLSITVDLGVGTLNLKNE